MAISSSNGVMIGLKNSYMTGSRPDLRQEAESTNLGVDQTVLGTSNEDEALYLEEVGKF